MAQTKESRSKKSKIDRSVASIEEDMGAAAPAPTKVKRPLDLEDPELIPGTEEKTDEDAPVGEDGVEEAADDEAAIDDEDVNPFGDKWEG